MKTRFIRLALSLVVPGLFLVYAPETGAAPSPALTLTAPGMGFQSPHTLLVAARLNNTTAHALSGVRLGSARLDTAPVLTQLPVSVGKIPAEQAAIVHVNFDSTNLIHEKQYHLVLRGSYRTPSGTRQRFVVRTVLVLPPAAPGRAKLLTATVKAHAVRGAPFPQRPPRFDEDVNLAHWTVPTGRFAPGTPTKSPSSATPAPFGDPPAVVFDANNGLGITGASTITEPSGATNSNGVVFASGNWFAAYSTNGGSSFTQVNPTTVFPNDAIGFCCDQIVQYVPRINRFIWLLQGTNGDRLASATPAAIASSGASAWTYWNLPSTLFGQPTGTGLDYPDVSVGTNALYLSWDVGFPSCPTGCRSGLQVSRISLAGIQAGGTITIAYTNPANSAVAWGSHLTQDTGDEIFWAGHNSNSQLRVFSLAEGSNTYFWRDIGIASWANNQLSSLTPDNQNWLAGSGGFPGNAIIGSTRVGNQVWFAWDAGTDNRFAQPHIEMVALDRANNFAKTQQVQIWNPQYAFAYPALATNACTGEVGLSFEYGGGGNYENHVVGFWGDFIAYITTGSNVGTTRFGDYVSIRQAPPTKTDPGNLFAAFGYGVNKVPPPGTGTTSDAHYVLFGRPASACGIR